jgi:hypothetical protein
MPPPPKKYKTNKTKPTTASTKPNLHTIRTVVLTQLQSLAKNQEATWLFLFVPFLCLTIALFQSHFAHRKLGTLHIVPGREPSAVAIFPFAPTTGLEMSPVFQEVANGGFTWAEVSESDLLLVLLLLLSRTLSTKQNDRTMR